MRVQKILAAAGVALLMTGLGANAAYADDSGETDTIVVSGQELGPKEGLSITTESYEIAPGGGQVGATYASTPSGEMSTQQVWGSSYAFSEESFYIDYLGYAKAGANVYDGLRIVRVCFWWTQDTRTSVTTCANATFSGGSWYASPEVTSSFRDSLDSDAPQTIFHIQTSRIDPNF